MDAILQPGEAWPLEVGERFGDLMCHSANWWGHGRFGHVRFEGEIKAYSQKGATLKAIRQIGRSLNSGAELVVYVEELT